MRDQTRPFPPTFSDYEFQNDSYIDDGALARPLDADPRPLTDEVDSAAKVIIYPPAPSPAQAWAVVAAEGRTIAETVEQLLPCDWQYLVSDDAIVAEEVKHLALVPGTAHRLE